MRSLFCVKIFMIRKQKHPLIADVFFSRCLAIPLKFLKVLRSALEKNLKSLSCSIGHVECSFNNPAETFGWNSDNFCSQSPKMMTEFYTFSIKWFLKIFPWTHREFDNPAESFSSEIFWISARIPKTFCKKHVGQKVLQKVALDTWSIAMATMPRFLCQLAEAISLKVPERWENFFWSRKNYYSKCPSGHVKCSFGNPTKKILPNFIQKIKKIFLHVFFLPLLFLLDYSKIPIRCK